MFNSSQVTNLIEEVRVRISYRLPQDANFDELVSRRMQDIVDSVIERTTFALEQSILGAQSILTTQAEKYINGLNINDNLEIEIDDDVKYLEYGYGSWNMLENLITGPKAKVAKDGSLYNIIPIGKNKESNVKDAIASKTHSIVNEGAAIGGSIGNLKNVVDSMISKIHGANNTPSSEPTKFVTASSKQNADDKWVHPGFTGVHQLDNINHQLKLDLIEVVSNIIESESWRSN